MIYWDLDGVIRNLSGNIIPGKIHTWGQLAPNGQTICDYIDNHLDVLETAKPTIFRDIVMELPRIALMTRQPEHWRKGTIKWIKDNIPGRVTSITWVKNIEDKLEYLNKDDILIEDYPYFSDYSQIYLVDWPYNECVQKPLARVLSPNHLRRLLGLRERHDGIKKNYKPAPTQQYAEVQF